MSSTQQAKEEEKALLAAAAGGSTAVIAQLLLIGLTLLPLAIVVPANANIIATASLCVFVGCWRSVKLTAPSETMTKKVSMQPVFHVQLSACLPCGSTCKGLVECYIAVHEPLT